LHYKLLRVSILKYSSQGGSYEMFKTLHYMKGNENAKNRRFSYILFEISDKDSLRIEKCINVVGLLLNWVLFDRIACTVVLFNSPFTVTQRNLERRLKSRHVSCHNTSMMWDWEVWSYIQKIEHWFFARLLPTKMILFLLRWDIKFINSKNRNVFGAY